MIKLLALMVRIGVDAPGAAKAECDAGKQGGEQSQRKAKDRVLLAVVGSALASSAAGACNERVMYHCDDGLRSSAEGHHRDCWCTRYGTFGVQCR
ncbi:uncharacterized protein SCHCODRAFT_02632383 [Schizophyllum commune H4-8]|uniref:uncharacterized protein n=1 Tax=Schizophyllum commune (strain H4-8 / FGSC 9210) TaxID=578458 RepID=UPI002160EF45|nr:uncharacterized protein SCHCODRAFT_02632383 [Schizophyllum commune H4-8]KAI5890612.1 hypothetical protein SCHCODRAFT_02632383 [Schizophyllum commune H4-8]